MSNDKPASIDQALIKLDDNSVFDIFREQLLKDVALCGMPSDDIDCNDINALIRSLIAFVEHYMKIDPESLRSLLYRIDLDESILVDLVTAKNQNYEVLAHAIVIRELQKVLYRIKGRLD